MATANTNEPPNCEAADLQRFDYLTAAELRAYNKTDRWRSSWMTFYGALALGQLTYSLSLDNRDRKVDVYTSAATAIVGFVAIARLPLLTPAKHEHFQNRFRQTADKSSKCLQLGELEQDFANIAAGERQGKSFKRHASAVAFNVGVALFLGFGFHHWRTAVVKTITGIAISELAIYSQPTLADDSRHEYEGLSFGLQGANHSPSTPRFLTYQFSF